jgi:hypothetical protein
MDALLFSKHFLAASQHEPSMVFGVFNHTAVVSNSDFERGKLYATRGSAEIGTYLGQARRYGQRNGVFAVGLRRRCMGCRVILRRLRSAGMAMWHNDHTAETSELQSGTTIENAERFEIPTVNHSLAKIQLSNIAPYLFLL